MLLLSGDAEGDGEDEAESPANDVPAATASPSASPRTLPPVPKGYHLFEDKKTRVAFPVPDGWTRKQVPNDPNGAAVYVDPSGLVRLEVSVLDLASSDPLQRWVDDEAKSVAEGKLPGYKQLRMQDTEFRGEPAALWEFTFKGRARDYRAVDLGFGRPGGNEYAIYLSAPSADWARYKKVFDDVKDGFRPSDEH